MSPRETPANSRLALGGLISGAVGIACAPIFVRLSEVGSTATAFWRLALALPFLWLWTELGVGLGAGGCGASSPQAPHPPRGDPGRAVLRGGPRLLALVDRFHLRGELHATGQPRPGLRGPGGHLLFGLVGGDLGLGLRQLFGDALAMLAAVFYAGYILSVSRLRSGLSTAAVMAYGGVVTCAALLPVALLSGEDLLATSAYGWLMLLGIALVSQIGGQSLITYSLADLPAAFSSVGLLLQPMAAAALAWAILGEALGWWQALGDAVVLTGIVLARRGSLPGDRATSRSRPGSTRPDSITCS